MKTVDLIGLNIKRILKEKGIRMHKVESETTFSYGMLSKYVNGKNYPSCYTLCLLADYLNVDVREFFTPEDEPTTLEVVRLFKGISPTMQKAVIEIMKTTQEGGKK